MGAAVAEGTFGRGAADDTVVLVSAEAGSGAVRWGADWLTGAGTVEGCATFVVVDWVGAGLVVWFEAGVDEPVAWSSGEAGAGGLVE
jgi:hypothetical protein